MAKKKKQMDILFKRITATIMRSCFNLDCLQFKCNYGTRSNNQQMFFFLFILNRSQALFSSHNFQNHKIQMQQQHRQQQQQQHQ